MQDTLITARHLMRNYGTMEAGEERIKQRGLHYGQLLELCEQMYRDCYLMNQAMHECYMKGDKDVMMIVDKCIQEMTPQFNYPKPE